MAFQRPQLTDLVDRITSDLETRLQTSGKVLRRSVIKVIGRVLAGAAHLMHGHLSFIAEQVFPDTAVKSNLERWGSIWGVEKIPASFAAGNLTISGTNGLIIEDKTVFSRSDGVEFIAQGDTTIVGGTAMVPVRAAVAGDAGDTDAGTTLNFVAPVAGINSSGTVDGSGITGGEDEETDDNYSDRIIQRIQQPPMGGSASDYEQWTREVAGVTRAWIYREYLGPGTVGITFVNDNENPIFPSQVEIETVSGHIEPLRPVTATHIVFAPTGQSIDFTIQLSPDTSAVRAAVESELEDMIFRDSQPGGTILLSHMREAVSIAAGEVDHILSSPSANFVSDSGHLPQMGTVTWV